MNCPELAGTSTDKGPEIWLGSGECTSCRRRTLSKQNILVTVQTRTAIWAVGVSGRDFKGHHC